MKKINYTLALLFAVIMASCGGSERHETEENSSGKFYYIKSNSDGHYLEIIMVRDCEYVLWHRGYGSDMEHYAGCTNPIHYNNNKNENNVEEN